MNLLGFFKKTKAYLSKKSLERKKLRRKMMMSKGLIEFDEKDPDWYSPPPRPLRPPGLGKRKSKTKE